MIKNQKGSMTVELSLLIVILLFSTLFLIDISGYLYNRERIVKVACSAVILGGQMDSDDSQSVEKRISSYIQEETKDRLIFHPTITYKVGVTKSNVKVDIKLSQDFVLKNAALPFLQKGKFSYEVSQKGSRKNPAEMLMKGVIVEKVWKGIKDG